MAGGPLRRALDCAAALTGLAVLAPLGLVISAAIKAEDGGPVFYSHPRVGRNFSRFRLLKFRTMVPGADRRGGPVTLAGDPRVTRVGRILRRYKLDELPQLLNVVCGQMSLVGPRPECEQYVALFRARFEPILRYRPGITDPATLAFRHEEELLTGADAERIYAEKILPRKIALSAAYLESRSLLSDLKILAQTLVAIVRPQFLDPLACDPAAGDGRPDLPAALQQGDRVATPRDPQTGGRSP